MKELAYIWKQESKLSKEEVISFLITVFAGVMTYYQMPSNWLTNPDTVWNSIYFRVGHGGEKINGRLFQIIVDKLRMNMVTPVLTTVICVVLLGIIALIIGRIFESSFIVKVFTGLLLIFVPCTSSSLTYYYCSDSFMLAFVCVVLGSYLIKKYPSVLSYILATGMFTAALYLYQAYICVVFTLALLLLLLTILEGKEPVKKALTMFFHFVFTSGAAVIIYVVSFKVLQIVLHINVRTDRGLGFTDIFGSEGIISLLGQAYVNFYEYFFGNRLLNNNFGDRNLINIFVVAAIIGMVVFGVIRNKVWKQPERIVILFLSIGLLPLAVEAITVMSPKVDEYGPTGIIMLPTAVFVYILVLVMGNTLTKQKKALPVSVISCFTVLLFLWNSVVFTNLCINSMQLNLNKAEAVADLMLERIVEEIGYEKNTKLLVAGHMEDGNFPVIYGWPEEVIKGTSASYGFMWKTYTGNENCWIEFLKQYKGVTFKVCEQEQYENLLEQREYQGMPIFPQEGSVQKFGDTIVVKMSDVELE